MAMRAISPSRTIASEEYALTLTKLGARPGGRPGTGSFPMNRSMVANRWNLDLIEENHQRWRNDPASVDESWRIFFEGYELGHSGDGVAGTDVDHDAARAQAAVT